jgi:hypothetical protein
VAGGSKVPTAFRGLAISTRFGAASGGAGAGAGRTAGMMALEIFRISGRPFRERVRGSPRMRYSPETAGVSPFRAMGRSWIAAA